MTETNTRVTRRGILTTTAGLLALTRHAVGSAAASISFELNRIFEIQASEVRRPDQYTYDAIDFRADTGDTVSGILEFYDDGSGLADDRAVFTFGDTNYRPLGPEDADTAPTISLPLSINIYDMDTGTSVFLIGMLGTLLGAAVTLRNVAASIAWGFAVMMLVLAGLFGFGLEIFWLSIVAVTILLVAGVVVRWSR